MAFVIRSQRDAIAISMGWDRSEVEEYQVTRPRDPKVKLFNVGDGFGVAVKEGKPVPAAIVQEFGPWHRRETIGGWTIYCDTMALPQKMQAKLSR